MMNFNVVKSQSGIDVDILLTSPSFHASYFYFDLEFNGTNNMVNNKAPLHGFELNKDCDIKLSKNKRVSQRL